MKIAELKEFIEVNRLKGNDDIDTLIKYLIVKDKILNFNPILGMYIAHLEQKREYTKCELVETASLLHTRKLGIHFEGQSERELHMINKHSNLSCKEENEKEGYDAEKSENEFRKIYNLD